MLTAQWNTGWLVGIWVIVIIQVVFMAIGVTAGVYWLIKGKDNPYGFSGIIAGIALAIFLVAGIIGTVVAFPFSGAYHRYQPISGTVTSISSRFLSDGNGTTQNYVVMINGQQYRVDDTRGALLHKGSNVTLMCTKTFQFNAAAGWVCNWGKLGLNR